MPTLILPSRQWLLILLISALIVFASTSQAFDRDALAAALESSDRDINDRMLDEARKPVDVLEFLGVAPGMQVLDVYAAGGYYTFVLSRAVGLRGTVFAQNSPRAPDYDQDRTDMTPGDALARTIERGQLLNVERIDRGINNMNLPDRSLDFVLVSQILHDYYNRSPARALGLMNSLYRALKPGGIVGVIDHSGLGGLNNERLHRMQKSEAIAVAQQAGFILEAESDILAREEDNLRRSVFDPMLRHSDQFLLRFRKPE